METLNQMNDADEVIATLRPKGATPAEVERAQAAMAARSPEASARRPAEVLLSMADELRVPLNTLMVLSKLLADNEGGNLTAQQVDFAQTIYAAGNDLLSVVDDVLDLARIEADRAAPQVTDLQFRDLRLYLLRAFRLAARERRLAFDVVLAPDVPPSIRTDARRLRHALKMMLSSAVKAADGSLTLAIAAVGANAVFEARYRVPVGGEAPFGPGLSICRELAQALGGELHAGRRDADEACVALLLPLAFVGGMSAAARPERTAGLPPETAVPERRARCSEDAVMLIVEGNAQVASVMLDLVRANGYQGVVASDMGTMKVLLREVAPEGILVGGSLLDIDGWSTLELLKRDPLTRRVPLSMSTFDSRRYLCLQIGARCDWGPGGGERLLAGLDAAAGRRLARLLLAGLPEADGCELRDAGRELTRVAGGAEAIAALRSRRADALVIGPALSDMTGIELVRAIGAAERHGDDLPLALVEPGGAPCGTVDIAMLRQRARLEDILGETALFLACHLGHRSPRGRDGGAGRRDISPELAGRKALVVDDDIYSVYAITGALEQQGMTVLLAENARDGIAVLRENPDTDVVLIDITMPEIDGDSVIHAMRGTHERALPVIAVTARALPGDREKCIAAGASDYLAKPVNVGQMLALLRTWLARSR